MRKPKKYKFPPWADWWMWGKFLKSYKSVTERMDKRICGQSKITLAEFELMYAINDSGGRIRFKDLADVTLLSQSRIRAVSARTDSVGIPFVVLM